MQPGSGGYRAVGWRVYRLYHKLRSAGGDNVWCTHCDWREQPPPSNPASPVTWYQRERHSSAGKAIPCSRSVFCTSRPSLDSFPPQFISIAFLLFHFLVLSLSFIPSFSPPTHCPLHLAVQMWPYLGLWEGVAVGAGGRREGGVEIITMAMHSPESERVAVWQVHFTHFHLCYYNDSRESWKRSSVLI